jgi:hypothetical protein
LQSFAKPNKTVFEEKECLICLESLNVELNKIVELPCKCSNSVYHIDCIVRLLESGQNKNFCPHCKTPYQTSVFSQNEVVDRQPPENNEKNIVYIFVVHILSNTMMNMINIGLTIDYQNVSADITSKILMVSYFCKILLNVCFVCRLTDNRNRLMTYVGLSYIIQSLMFVLLVCLLSYVKFDFTSWMLLTNNVVFFLSDFAFRISIEYCS